jgi:aryl-alcohol dehydrogenase-like predicted oxidoreductase
MEQRRIGTGTGVEVSTLCLGALPFGSLVDEETSMAILDRFVEAGGTFIDTSDNYVCWVEGFEGSESESLLGRWMQRRGNRDQLVLATKVGALPRRFNDWTELEGLSAGVIQRQARQSLSRLRTDHVDLYYAHVEDRSVPLEETMGAFAGLVADGTVRVLGCSNHATWRVERSRAVARAHGWPGYQVIQQRHTYARPRPGATFGVQRHVDDELLDYVRNEPDLTLLGYSTLMFGAYSRADKAIPVQYDYEGTAKRIRVLHEVARDIGATPNQVVLAWLLGGDPPVIPILGVSSVAQLDECLGAADIKLDDDIRARLDAAGDD